MFPQIPWAPQDPQTRHTTKPIVSSCGSVTYDVAKELTKTLKPLIGKSPHHINGTKGFVEQVKHMTLAPRECLSSYDVSALFTSVPVDPAQRDVKDLLEKNPTLKDRTVLPVEDIILLLEFCLKNMYFSFQDQLWTDQGCGHGFPGQPHYSLCIYGILWAKCSQYCLHPPGFGTGMWMTHLLSTRKSINRTSFNMSAVLPFHPVYSGDQ